MNDKFHGSDSEEIVDIGLPTLLIDLAAALSGRVCAWGKAVFACAARCGFGCVCRHIVN